MRQSSTFRPWRLQKQLDAESRPVVSRLRVALRIAEPLFATVACSSSAVRAEQLRNCATAGGADA